MDIGASQGSAALAKPAAKSTSYDGVTAHQNSRLHAGDVYSNVTNNFATEAITKESSLTSSSRTVPKAPPGSPVHEQFVRAVREGQHTSRLEYLLAQGADVDAEDLKGVTALYYAAFRGDHANVCLLLKNGADVNSRHDFFGTPILAAALKSRKDVVETLLKHKADISATFKGLGSALHCACFSGDINIVESLMQHGDSLERCELVLPYALAEIAATSVGATRSLSITQVPTNFQVRCSPVCHAAAQHHFDLLRVLRSRYRVDYLSIPVCNLTPQPSSMRTEMISTQSKDSTWSSFGIPLEPSTDEKHLKHTMLMWAAAFLDLDLIDHLLAAGASATVQDENRRTALHHASLPFPKAAFADVTSCVQKLVEGGATFPKEDLEDLVTIDHVTSGFLARSKLDASIHTTFVSAFLGAVSSVEGRREASHMALPLALSHPFCPESSIRLLCEHAVEPSQDIARQQAAILCFSSALSYGLRNADADSIIVMLLEYGAIADRSIAGHLLPTTDLDVLRVEDVTSILRKHSAGQNLPEFTDANTLPLSIAIDAGVSLNVVTALLKHGADPAIPESQFGRHPGLTPFEIAKRCGRKYYIPLFEGRNASLVKAHSAARDVARSWRVKLSAIPMPSFLRDSGRK